LALLSPYLHVKTKNFTQGNSPLREKRQIFFPQNF